MEEVGRIEAPKRPLSPFIFYSQEARRALRQSKPELHSKQIMVLVKKQWRDMSDEQKESYKEQSKTNRDEFEERRKIFDE